MPRLLPFLSLLLLAATVEAGLRVDVIGAERILPRDAYTSTTIPFESTDGVKLTLALRPDVLDVQNPNAGSHFVPIERAAVELAIARMEGVEKLDLDVRVYCLPGMGTEQMRSFALGREVFLMPAFARPSQEVVAATVVHEIGHVLQHTRMPGRRGARWLEYLSLRDIEDTARFHDGAVHRDRPGEIFAEDFRMLYGGPDATGNGTLENRALPLPQQVQGLESYFGELAEGRVLVRPASARNYPNPFNPRTTIVVSLPDQALIPGAVARTAVFDARGRRVRDLGARAVAAELRFVFDGRDDAGSALASGRYFYRVVVGDEQLAGSMLLLE